MERTELEEIYHGLEEMRALLNCAQSFAVEMDCDTLSIALLHILQEMQGLMRRTEAAMNRLGKEGAAK